MGDLVDDILCDAHLRLRWTNEAAVLEYNTRLVEIGQLPIYVQLSAIRQLESTLNSQPIPVQEGGVRHGASQSFGVFGAFGVFGVNSRLRMTP